MRALSALLALILSLSLTPAAQAVECRKQEHLGKVFTLCEVDARIDDVMLFHTDPRTGEPFGTFSNIDSYLEETGRKLGLAMNAGMYHQDRSPVGLFQDGSGETAPLVTTDGPGNFGLLPNGVFCLQEGRAHVIESLRFKRENPACRAASQSGPMLVIGGKLHPRFLPDSDSRYIRNGVGTSADGRRIVLAISDTPVTFHEFGTLFRDTLGLPDALYFDGKISRLYAPAMDRFDAGFPMGPIVGVVVPR